MGELKQLGRHEIVSVLGSGATGVVYEAYDRELRRRVAVKILVKGALPGAARAEEFSARFLREAQPVAQLDHPNIVRVYDFGEQDNVVFWVMELVRGHALQQSLDCGEQFPLPVALGYMMQLLSALDYAHALGVIHCDIKPANILIDERGWLKLTDFGVARVLDGRSGAGVTPIGGTPYYMSPEQILGVPVGPASDIFAAGIVLYVMLTQRKPFNGEDAPAIQDRIVNEQPAPPSSLNRSLPPALDAVVARALAKKPEHRYARAAQFSGDLQRILSAGPGTKGQT